MSNQVYRNQDYRYDNANISSVTYVLTADEAIATGVAWLPVTTMTIDQDLGMGTDVVHSAGVFTFKRDGLYSMDFNPSFTANATGYRSSSIHLTQVVGDGQRAGLCEVPTNSLNSNTSVTSSFQYYLKAGDTLSIEVIQTSGAPLNLVGGVSDPRSRCVITRIA